MSIKNIKIGDKVKLIKLATLLKNGIIYKHSYSTTNCPYKDAITGLLIVNDVVEHWNDVLTVKEIYYRSTRKYIRLSYSTSSGSDWWNYELHWIKKVLI